MAQLENIVIALMAEMEERLEDLVPIREPSKRFRMRRDRDYGSKDISEVRGRPRLFEITPWPEKIRNTQVGHDSRRAEYRHMLRIQYPNTLKWNIAAAGDSERITHDFLNNKTTTDGVSIRIVDPDSQPRAIPDEEEAWFLLEIDFLVEYETSDFVAAVNWQDGTDASWVNLQDGTDAGYVNIQDVVN
jgi:hypothetical protein